ncbi:CheW domain-containing protein [Pseudomonas matsuisoli]|uniref:Chemotaxis protein CheW n=1 Tax=Pseudomonas matsuisoli TaxID=1515666 RepID=A0A917PJ92_9PSED|nr:CheW domain-containing protein [Pseudomonas matsuisoli]GGJ80220.1 chemotaxis protein CheW [Pseudomonas matsuisoli]
MSQSTATVNRTQLTIQSYLDTLLQDAQIELADSVSVEEFEAAVREEQQRDALKVVPRQVNTAPAPESAPLAYVALEPVAELPLTDMPVSDVPVADVPVADMPVADVPLLDQVEYVETSISPATRMAELEPAVTTPVVEPLVVLKAQASTPPPPANYETPPAWAQEPFECLLFDVAGLTLAVPLACLGSIYPLNDRELTPLFGQPDWFLGILPSQAGNLKVLDAARWVMPERYRDDFREGLQYVISVQGCEWGMAVHNVSHSIRLDPREVKWRMQRAQRPWLAGTVVEHMCALLDVSALADLLLSGAIRHASGAAARQA